MGGAAKIVKFVKRYTGRGIIIKEHKMKMLNLPVAARVVEIEQVQELVKDIMNHLRVVIIEFTGSLPGQIMNFILLNVLSRKAKEMKYTLLAFILSIGESINCFSQELPIKPARTISFTT